VGRKAWAISQVTPLPGWRQERAKDLMHNQESQEEIVRRILELRVEHRDLDDAIEALANADYVDQIQLKRLKKKKLALKDTIQRLESELIPDVDA
jgi:hypothetical protein